MINSEIAKLLGQPLNRSAGQATRAVSVSGPGDLGMGQFNPRKGANTHGKYIVDGVGGSGGGSKGRSHLRAAGASPGVTPGE